MYLSKNCILKALSVLFEAKPNTNGNNFSAIQYFLATDIYWEKYKKPCDSSIKKQREEFCGYVAEIVSLDDQNYLSSFKQIYEVNDKKKPKSVSQTVGSNFFTASSVKQSKNTHGKAFDYPASDPLIYAENGSVYCKDTYYPNLKDYLQKDEEKIALVIWLLRKKRGFKDLKINEFRDLLGKTYTSLMVDTLIPEKIKEWDDIIEKFEVECVDEVAVIKKEDIVGTKHLLITPQIFYGAPGTGKTRHVQKNIYDTFDEKARVFTTFHQSYSYEDFVEGLKPILDESSKDVKYHIEKGVFYEACEKAAELTGYENLIECIEDTKENRTNKFNTAINEDKIMLLCIDEINRGNVASIFGDLISLIEPSKRLGAGEYEMIVTLPYSKKKFGVPANLLIVGTMNTADRSIQLLDSALRRRFEFVEMKPELDTIEYEKAQNVLKNINNRIRCLLNKDNQIGHSYLVNSKSDSDILKAIIYKIIPLLEEYFYNDIDKVRFVLNETEKVEKPFYIEDEDAAKAYQLYSDGIDEPKSFFRLDEKIKDFLDDEEESEKYIEHLL